MFLLYIIIYFCIAGIVMAPIFYYLNDGFEINNDKKIILQNHEDINVSVVAGLLSFFVGFFWPIILPMFLCFKLVEFGYVKKPIKK